MAVDLTSLGAHRLPVRRYEEFSHVPAVDEVATLTEIQTASLVRAVGVIDVGAVLQASQDALFDDELVRVAFTSVGPNRLPTRRYESFDHLVVETGAVAETTTAAATQSAVGVQGVDVAEVVGFTDAAIAQSALPDSVSDVLTAEDTVDAALTRAGALVSTLGPMGMPRQRWVDFIHPAAVDEVVSLLDSQDAGIPGEIVDFVHEVLSAVDATITGAIFHDSVVDGIALSDSSTTGTTFAGAIDEAAPILDSTDAEIEAVEVSVSEVNALVDILVVNSIFRNTVVEELGNLQDNPGVAGELWDTVAESATATAMFDITGAFVPGVNIDGARTVHVDEEVRELEVMA